jgi:hypothetical protein
MGLGDRFVRSKKVTGNRVGDAGGFVAAFNFHSDAHGGLHCAIFGDFDINDFTAAANPFAN